MIGNGIVVTLVGIMAVKDVTVMLAAAVGGVVVTAHVMMIDASVARWPVAVL
jgi:hypothetical protein